MKEDKPSMIRQGIYRFGKSMLDVYAIKRNFFEENDKLLDNSTRFSELYRKQKVRENCKICSEILPREKHFTNHGTDYYLCGRCGHLSGRYDDGVEYTKELYESGLYATDYWEADPILFNKRMDAIFIPKLNFMLDSFLMRGINANEMSYLEIGAGAGHLILSMNRAGLDVIGVEISESQVEFANKMIGKELILTMSADKIAETIRTTDREVLIFINVLEHITNLNEVLDSIKANRKIKYIFFSVPLLSLTCAFEVIFSQVYPRHIGGGGGHTHLFSEKSLAYIFDKYDFKRISTWEFGTDIMDLYRSIVVTLETKGCHQEFITKISTLFQEQSDAIQLIIDKSGMASDTHIVAQVH